MNAPKQWTACSHASCRWSSSKIEMLRMVMLKCYVLLLDAVATRGFLRRSAGRGAR